MENNVLEKKNQLNEKQMKFCFYYLQNFNASLAAKKAGYTQKNANVQGYRLLKNKRIMAMLEHMKKEMTQGVCVDAIDVLNMYARIAFADIKDYIEIQESEKGLLVRAKELENIDGQIVEEIFSTATGIKIKLCDRMRALEKLEKYFDLLSESWRREIEERKLELSLEKRGSSIINVITNIPRPQAEEPNGTED